VNARHLNVSARYVAPAHISEHSHNNCMHMSGPTAGSLGHSKDREACRPLQMANRWPSMFMHQQQMPCNELAHLRLALPIFLVLRATGHSAHLPPHQ